ncbi:hypothetical protein BN946_scf184977.g44 [Trametes cinnabarina]|uniref:Uncharacterized protein n=1 Tax=Pycnoporus cinnabarinus TaxID=5643 RepID=A0A060SCZ5_PYCCI|nr:hypothetical protein BN946_scf184977.g44 [Trametes cinnabarina]
MTSPNSSLVLLERYPKYRNKDVSLESYKRAEDAPPDPIRLFSRESLSDAHAHLQHHGACDAAGAVPKCLGRLDLTGEDMDAIAASHDIAKEWRALQEDESPPHAMLLE